MAFPFDAPPTPEIGLHNISVIACFVDSTGTEECDGFTADSVPYFVDPTPTLDLDPVSGYATSAFSATYSTHDVGCPYDSVQFEWDGAAIGAPVSDERHVHPDPRRSRRPRSRTIRAPMSSARWHATVPCANRAP